MNEDGRRRDGECDPPWSRPLGSTEGHSGRAGSVPGEVSACTAHLKAYGSSSLEKAGKLGKEHFKSNKKITLGMDEGKGQNQTENCAFVSLKMGLINSPPFAFDSGQFLHVQVLFDIKCQKNPLKEALNSK